jgi:Peptidase family M23
MILESPTTISINEPLEGVWKFLRPPGHHPFAFDFVKAGSDKKRTHRKSKLHFVFGRVLSEAYYCWEEPIYSPISGKVIRVGKDWPDHEYTNLWNTIKVWYNATFKFKPREENGVLDIRPNAGNYVMIQSDDDYILFLAHFRNNSITVRQGERVQVGDQLGLVGNSGNSTAPHLHINLFDQMDDPFDAKVLPFVFNNYEIRSDQDTWINSSASVPKVGSLVKFKRVTNRSTQTA